MPLVRIEMMKGHTKEYKKTYLQAVHEALMNSLNIPDDDRFQRLYELETDNFETNDTKTDQFAIIELTLFPGRSKELKEKAIKEINRLLSEKLNIQSTDIFIIIHEPPLDNWGMRGDQVSNYRK